MMTEQEAIQLILSNPTILIDLGFSEAEIAAGVNPLNLSTEDPRRELLLQKVVELVSGQAGQPGLPTPPASFQGMPGAPMPTEVPQAPMAPPMAPQMPPAMPEMVPPAAAPEMAPPMPPVAPEQAPPAVPQPPTPPAPEMAPPTPPVEPPKPPTTPMDKNIRGSNFPKLKSAGAKKYESKFSYAGTGGMWDWLKEKLQPITSAVSTSFSKPGPLAKAGLGTQPKPSILTPNQLQTVAAPFISAVKPLTASIKAPSKISLGPVSSKVPSAPIKQSVDYSKLMSVAPKPVTAPISSKVPQAPVNLTPAKQPVGNISLATPADISKIVAPVAKAPVDSGKIDTIETVVTPVLTSGSLDASGLPKMDNELINKGEVSAAVAEGMGSTAYAWNEMLTSGFSKAAAADIIEAHYRKQFDIDKLSDDALAKKNYFETAVPKLVEDNINAQDKTLKWIQIQKDFIYDQIYQDKSGIEGGSPWGFGEVGINEAAIDALNKLQGVQIQSYDRLYRAITNKAQGDVNNAVNAYNSAYDKYKSETEKKVATYKEYWDNTYSSKKDAYDSLTSAVANANIAELSNKDLNREWLNLAMNEVGKGGQAVSWTNPETGVSTVVGFYRAGKDGKPDPTNFSLMDGFDFDAEGNVIRTSAQTSDVSDSGSIEDFAAAGQTLIPAKKYAGMVEQLAAGWKPAQITEAAKSNWYWDHEGVDWFLEQIEGAQEDPSPLGVDQLLGKDGKLLQGKYPPEAADIDRWLAEGKSASAIKAMIFGKYGDSGESAGLSYYYLDSRLENPAPKKANVGSDTKSATIVSGKIGNKTIKVSKSIFNPLALADSAFFKATGQHLQINSAYRSVAEQRAIRARFGYTSDSQPSGYNGLPMAAPPGQSNHQNGRAIDIGNWQVAEKFLRKYGLANNIKNDKNHFELV